MNIFNNSLLVIILLLLTHCTNHLNKEYIAHKGSIDEYFGHKIEDPYRYLENTEDTTVLKIFEKKTNEAHQILSLCTEKFPLERNKTKKKHQNITKIKVREAYYFYLKKEAPDSNRKLYRRKHNNQTEELIFDVNQHSILSNKKYAINYYQPDWIGTKVAISLSKNDGEISNLIVYDIESKKIISEMLENTWPSALGGIRWLPDNTGFTYEHIPVTDKKSKDYLLNVKTILYSLSKDKENKKVIFSKDHNPEIKMKAEDFPEVNFKSKSSSFVFANVSGASSYADYYFAPIGKLHHKNISWKPLYKRTDKIKTFELSGNEIYFLTSKNASNFKICKTTLLNPNIEHPEIIVEEDSLAVISDFTMTRLGLFYVKTKNGVVSKLYLLQNNIEKEIELPGIFGSIRLFSTGVNSYDLWIETRGWTSGKQRYQLDKKTLKFTRQALFSSSINELQSNTFIEEIEIRSHDGIKVPLSIIYNKDIKKDRNNAVLINAYGAYRWVNKPFMNTYLYDWVKSGGIYAVAHVRGGGEKGDSWYKDGYKSTKPNSWKDLIACVEYLIKENYTNPNMTAVWGASAGGITIGRAITERPDLFKAAVIKVGMLNMLRSEFGPNGKNNTKEFGTITDSLDFKSLLEMDAYQQIKDDVAYPAVYLIAGMNDARVAAWQTAKFAFKLQGATTSQNPIILDIDHNGGHGFEASEQKKNTELTKIMSFLKWQTKHSGEAL